jgi:WD40 repeat protein
LLVIYNPPAYDKLVKIWNPFTGELIRNFTGHKKGLSDIAWAKDSVHLASGSDDTTIRIWDVNTVCPIHGFDQRKSVLIHGMPT